MSRSTLLAVAVLAALAAPACGLLRRERSAETAAPINLNTASLGKIESLPGVTPRMARRIVEGRPYGDPHELVERGILTERELDRILDRVAVGEKR
jgi:competence protein ComEA